MMSCEHLSRNTLTATQYVWSHGMKYVIFSVVCIGLSVTILLLSLWRQGQETLFPQAAFVAPSPAHSADLRVMPSALITYATSYNPKILPLTPLYLPKMVWQRLVLAIPRSKDDQQDLLLDRAEERMLIALYLWQQNSILHADANVLKSQQYLLRAAQIDTDGTLERLREVQTQHMTILESLETPSEFVSEAVALNKLTQSLVF